MKTTLKYLAAVLVVLALSAALAYITFYAMFGALILCLFYPGWLYFILGALFTGFTGWIGWKIFHRPIVYSLRR